MQLVSDFTGNCTGIIWQRICPTDHFIEKIALFHKRESITQSIYKHEIEINVTRLVTFHVQTQMMPWGSHAAEINVCNPFTNGVFSAYVSNEFSPLYFEIHASIFNNAGLFGC